MGYKPEVFVDGKWSRNGLVFATAEEAAANAQDLMSRWMLVTGARASEPVPLAPNYKWVDGKLVPLTEGEPS